MLEWCAGARSVPFDIDQANAQLKRIKSERQTVLAGAYRSATSIFRSANKVEELAIFDAQESCSLDGRKQPTHMGPYAQRTVRKFVTSDIVGGYAAPWMRRLNFRASRVMTHAGSRRLGETHARPGSARRAANTSL